MPEHFQEKVKYLCTLISEVEWSGVLFYSMEGTIQDPENCIITLEDILPMDKGTQAYTEYEFDKRVDDYLEEDIETRIAWHIGHIHSHNSMSVFFSGVDMSELVDNSKAHNIYLSLIVNNALDYIAKVAFRGEVNQVVEDLPFMASDENGELYEIGTGSLKISASKFYTYDCNIEAPVSQTFEVQKWAFAKRVAALFAPKKVKTWNNINSYPPPQQKKVKQFPLPTIASNNFNPFELGDEGIPDMEDMELVLASTIKGSLAENGKENLVSVLEEVMENGAMDGNDLAMQVSNNLALWYDNLIEDEDPTAFLDFLEECINTLEDLMEFYEVVGSTVEVLKAIFTKLEVEIKYGTTV